MSQRNKDLVAGLYAAMDRHDFEAAAAMLGPSFRFCVADNPPVSTQEEFVGVLQMFYTAFPDGRHDFRDILADGDQVVTAGTWTGTHQGTFQGVPASHKHVRINVIHIDRIVDDRIVEHRGVADFMSLMRQLSAVGEPSA